MAWKTNNPSPNLATYLLASSSARKGWNPDGHRHTAAQKAGQPIGKEGKPCPKVVSKWGQQGQFPGQLEDACSYSNPKNSRNRDNENLNKKDNYNSTHWCLHCPRAGHKTLAFVHRQSWEKRGSLVRGESQPNSPGKFLKIRKPGPIQTS